MKTIDAKTVANCVARLCLEANQRLRPDLLAALRRAAAGEKGRAARMIQAILANAAYARSQALPVCQDTGLPAVFLQLGSQARIKGDLAKAVLDGIEDGYRRGAFRRSIVRDPLKRSTPGYRGGVVHADLVPGNKLKITVLPKGFGCENKTALKMFNPTASLDEVRAFVVDTVKAAGPDACPPYIVGVGIGGSAEYACLLAKKALLRRISRPVDALEKGLLAALNRLKIGPMGLGGRTTALAVHVLRSPTHIAGLPVAVSISCHALRSASTVL